MAVSVSKALGMSRRPACGAALVGSESRSKTLTKIGFPRVRGGDAYGSIQGCSGSFSLAHRGPGNDRLTRKVLFLSPVVMTSLSTAG